MMLFAAFSCSNEMVFEIPRGEKGEPGESLYITGYEIKGNFTWIYWSNGQEVPIPNGKDGIPGLNFYETWLFFLTEEYEGCTTYECFLELFKGDTGENGKDGKDGKDGIGLSEVITTEEYIILIFTDGQEYVIYHGKDGTNGIDGTTITSFKKIDGCVFIKFSDGNEFTICDGKDGENGKDGECNCNNKDPEPDPEPEITWCSDACKDGFIKLGNNNRVTFTVRFKFGNITKSTSITGYVNADTSGWYYLANTGSSPVGNIDNSRVIKGSFVHEGKVYQFVLRYYGEANGNPKKNGSIDCSKIQIVLL